MSFVFTLPEETAMSDDLRQRTIDYHLLQRPTRSAGVGLPIRAIAITIFVGVITVKFGLMAASMWHDKIEDSHLGRMNRGIKATTPDVKREREVAGSTRR